MTSKGIFHNSQYIHSPKDVSIGNRVLLIWNGYPEVPRYAHHTWATVVGTTRTKIIVENPQEYARQLRVRPDQIWEVKE